MSDLENLIGNIQSGNNVAANTDFEHIMKSKLASALDARKIEVAGNVFSMGSAAVEEIGLEQETVADENI